MVSWNIPTTTFWRRAPTAKTCLWWKWERQAYFACLVHIAYNRQLKYSSQNQKQGKAFELLCMLVGVASPMWNLHYCEIVHCHILVQMALSDVPMSTVVENRLIMWQPFGWQFKHEGMLIVLQKWLSFHLAHHSSYLALTVHCLVLTISCRVGSSICPRTATC